MIDLLLASALLLPSSPALDEVTGHTPVLLERVAVLGASVTHGQGAKLEDWDLKFSDVLRATLKDPEVQITNHSDLFFFARPTKTGPSLLSQALATDPTLIVAVDFLFWFGYGTTGPEGGSLKSEDERLDLLEVGLELLDEIETPLVLGDFPDMSSAVGRMLQKSQVPEPETLEALNARLFDWSLDRDNVLLVALSDVVTDMRSKSGFSIGKEKWPAGSNRRLMQNDELHPTLDGLVVLARYITQELAAENENISGEAFRNRAPLILEELRANTAVAAGGER